MTPRATAFFAVDQIIKAGKLTVGGVCIAVRLGFIITYFTDIVKFIVPVFDEKSVTLKAPCVKSLFAIRILTLFDKQIIIGRSFCKV